MESAKKKYLNIVYQLIKKRYEVFRGQRVGMHCLWLCHTACQNTLTKQVKSDKALEFALRLLRK
jgi:hypothetical protein